MRSAARTRYRRRRRQPRPNVRPADALAAATGRDAREAPPELRPDRGDGGRLRPRPRRDHRADGRRLQNDPADIALLLEKLDEGYDVVSGWRQDRQDSVTRRLPSRIANWLIGRVTGVRLHDYGCTLKAYRAERARDPAVRRDAPLHPCARLRSRARHHEIPVTHHPRAAGKSKYGLGRTFKVMLDLLTVKFLSVFSTKPSYAFGGSGGGAVPARDLLSSPGLRTRRSSTGSTSTANRR